MKRLHAPLCVTTLTFAALAFPVHAKPEAVDQEDTDVAEAVPVIGRVKLPEEVPEGIDAEGLSISDVIVTLHGAYKHPRRPYPENWREMTRDQRFEWTTEFENSDAYEAYQRNVEEARSKRAVYTAKIEEDGSYTFKGVKPTWYQFSVMIMPANYEGEPNFTHARAWAMHQFFVKNTGQPHDMKTRNLKVKNVLMPGDIAPEWVATGYDGEKINLSDFRGRYVLFDFWATWCGPCIRETPNLKAVHKEFGGDRFVVVGLSTDETIDLPKDFYAENPSPYVNAYLGAGAERHRIGVAYGDDILPSIWLVGPDGRVIARDLRGKAIDEAVRSALKPKTQVD